MGGIGSGRKPIAVDVRMAKFIDLESNPPCWEWTGQIQQGSWHATGGYGRIKAMGKSLLAHRVAYALAYGEVPEGFDVDHRCSNRKCVNPEHLEATTHKENVRRIGLRKALTRDQLLAL